MKFFIGKLLAVTMLINFIVFADVKAQDVQADNMLLFQRPSGGWHKHFKGKAFSYTTNFSDDDLAAIDKEVRKDESTIDNGATTKEIRYLINAFKKTGKAAYLKAAEDGIRFLLEMQYENGGFPQYYPGTGLYRAQITFNDNAMINALNVLQDVYLGKNGFDVVDQQLISRAGRAITAGIECILKAQIRANGILTAWCQQYDPVSLQPATARVYELPSISGAESVKIVEFLMAQTNPSPQIKAAIHGAVKWFQTAAIHGYRVQKGTLIADANAPLLWARFYEIGTNKPFFTGRDGVKKFNLVEIERERRFGYAWYGRWANRLLEKDYPEWLQANE